MARATELYFLLDFFEVRELEVGGLPRTLRAIAEGSQPRGARAWGSLQVEDGQDGRQAGRVIRKLEMALERLAAGEPGTILRGFPFAWARTYPPVREVSPAMSHAHLGVTEGRFAVADTAVEVLLGEPCAPKCGLNNIGVVIGVVIVIFIIVLTVLFYFLASLSLSLSLRRHLVEASALNRTISRRARLGLYLIVTSLPSCV